MSRRRTPESQETDRADKICRVCGRRIEWRRRWADRWAEIAVCSARCRGTRLDDTDAALEAAILRLAAARGRKKTFCPSEAARVVDPEGWSALMARTRMAARRLVARGEIVITQGGQIVEPSTARGPIRLRRA